MSQHLQIKEKYMGQPAARVGDQIIETGPLIAIAAGETTVLIG